MRSMMVVYVVHGRQLASRSAEHHCATPLAVSRIADLCRPRYIHYLHSMANVVLFILAYGLSGTQLISLGTFETVRNFNNTISSDR